MAKKRKSKYTHISLAKKAANHAFSDYIRTRDKYTCITCGLVGDKHNIDAGHYIPRAHRLILYDEFNVHAQCFKCNCVYEGNTIIYRKKLIEKYGEEEVLRLENSQFVECKMSIQDYLDIEKKFREKLRGLE